VAETTLGIFAFLSEGGSQSVSSIQLGKFEMFRVSGYSERFPCPLPSWLVMWFFRHPIAVLGEFGLVINTFFLLEQILHSQILTVIDSEVVEVFISQFLVSNQ